MENRFDPETESITSSIITTKHERVGKGGEMRQTFLVELEWLAGDTPYSEGDLLEQLRTVFGREYDNEIYSVKEVLPKVTRIEHPDGLSNRS